MARSGTKCKRLYRQGGITKSVNGGYANSVRLVRCPCETWNLLLSRVSFLGAFDNKPDLTTFQATALPSPMSIAGTGEPSEPLPNPKLGLAPLSSELAFSPLNILSGRGGSRPPPSMPS